MSSGCADGSCCDTGACAGPQVRRFVFKVHVAKCVSWDPSQLAAYIFNLLSSGNTQSAATAIAQAATQGSSGANAIATAIATASSTVRVCVRACCFSALSEPGSSYRAVPPAVTEYTISHS